MEYGEKCESTREITRGWKCLHKEERQDLYNYLVDKIEMNMMGRSCGT